MRVEIFANTINQEIGPTGIELGDKLDDMLIESWKNPGRSWIASTCEDFLSLKKHDIQRLEGLKIREESFGFLAYDPVTTAVFLIDNEAKIEIEKSIESGVISDELFMAIKNNFDEALERLKIYRA